jgi:hypothetical protein
VHKQEFTVALDEPVSGAKTISLPDASDATVIQLFVEFNKGVQGAGTVYAVTPVERALFVIQKQTFTLTQLQFLVNPASASGYLFEVTTSTPGVTVTLSAVYTYA